MIKVDKNKYNNATIVYIVRGQDKRENIWGNTELNVKTIQYVIIICNFII